MCLMADIENEGKCNRNFSSFHAISNSSYSSRDGDDLLYEDLLNRFNKIFEEYLNLKPKFKVLFSANEKL